MHVVLNNCFLLNPEKKLAQIRLAVFEKKAKIAHFNFEMAHFKTMVSGSLKTVVSGNLKLSFNLSTV